MWVQSHLSSSFRQKLTIISCQQKHVREVSYEKLVQLTLLPPLFSRVSRWHIRAPVQIDYF